MPMIPIYNLKTVYRIVAAAAAWTILFFPSPSLAKQDTLGTSKIKVGTIEARLLPQRRQVGTGRVSASNCGD
jgi:hypothetical protein